LLSDAVLLVDLSTGYLRSCLILQRNVPEKSFWHVTPSLHSGQALRVRSFGYAQDKSLHPKDLREIDTPARPTLARLRSFISLSIISFQFCKLAAILIMSLRAHPFASLRACFAKQSPR